MKIFKLSFLALAVGSLLFFANCGGGGGNEPSEKETKTSILVDNSPWEIASPSSDVILPTEATTTDEWANLKLTFSATKVTVSGVPAGAEAVWPLNSTAWTANDDLTKITRVDGVVMTVLKLDQTTFKVTFSLSGKELGEGRVASLDGDYTFNFTSGK